LSKIIFITLDHKKKSKFFWLINGYLVKCGIITLFKSVTFDTLYTDNFLSDLVYTAPTPKKDCKLYKISVSFSCKFISNECSYSSF